MHILWFFSGMVLMLFAGVAHDVSPDATFTTTLWVAMAIMYTMSLVAYIQQTLE